jgi:hypothetical protein
MLMKREKKHKLLLIAPSGEKYQIGFLSPCTDGFVLGTSKVTGEETSHLTILNKEGTISAHITSQNAFKKRQHFPHSNVEEFSERVKSLVDDKMVFQLSQDQLSEDVLYLTRKFEDWFNVLIKALIQKKTTETEIIHVINTKKLLKQIPKLVEDLRNSPQSFFGMCKAKDMFQHDAIIGISNSKTLIIALEKELIGVDFRVFTNFDFAPSMDKSQLSSPITELYQSLGINQYMQKEVVEKKFLENLLSKENWQGETTKLDKKIRYNSANSS